MNATRKNEFNGPTAERIIQADGHISVGDDRQGNRLYTFLDSVLDRTYADLLRKNGEWMHDQLRVEYAALDKLYSVYIRTGMSGVGSIDMDRGEGGSRKDFLAATESQVHARNEYRRAQETMNHHEGIVVQNVVCNDRSLEIAGYAIGKSSQRRAIAGARDLLRDAGFKLAKLWGLVR